MIQVIIKNSSNIEQQARGENDLAGYIMTIGADEYLDLFYAVNKDGKPRKKPKNIASSKGEGKIMAKEYALTQCILHGTYSARSSGSGGAFIGTLADYLGMKKGDSIFFFTDRKIYGIGELIDIEDCDCRFQIHPNNQIEMDDLVETKDSSMHQFTCTFVPKPFFFRTGVDMDEVLMFSPEKIKSLRFFSGKTFMKLDDVESEAIKNVIARKNEEYLGSFDADHHFEYSDDTHKKIAENLKKNKSAYKLSVFDFIKRDNNGVVSSEYYIEGAIMDLLRNHTSRLIGKWDFIGRQYPASPPKPSEYEEAMDLFGYRYVPGFPRAISKYLVIELKVGTINKDNVQQTMKYVDWISREYTKGDYSMIEAYTIGFDKEANVETEIEDIIERNYIIESRLVENRKWQNLRILSYVSLLEELREKNNESPNE